MRRITVFLAPVLFLFSCSASALQLTERDGFYIYFPDQELQLAARLSDSLPEMVAFLSGKGLPVEPTVHVVVDDHLDAPEVVVHVIPHKEIRIPLRAPGVLQDGYTEADPWGYYMFRGLCMLGIYGMRSGIPGALYLMFGEAISPNLVLPPWVEDGVCNLMYSLYRGQPIDDPYRRSIFEAALLPDLDLISHHPQVWPGYHAYRIYGRPFVEWLYRRYGWERILAFLEAHGGGIIPFEIDLKAIDAFGSSGATLWNEFKSQQQRAEDGPPGLLVSGFWHAPLIYWNNAGVFPGTLRMGQRGRYGYVDDAGILWIAEYEGTSRIYRYGDRIERTAEFHSLWDPGPGRVVVGRRGHRSSLVIFPDDGEGGLRRARRAEAGAVIEIPAPEGAIQLSGPVRNEQGHIAVAVNTAGNWDIWVHDGEWHRLTQSPSVELDPWWQGETLVWASNASGRFQIHQADDTPITFAERGALMPRGNNYLELTASGWRVLDYESALPNLPPLEYLAEAPRAEPEAERAITPQPYDPFKSLWPNYIQPDFFAAVSDLQLGIETSGRDVSGDYIFDAGLRYTFDSDFLALQALLQRKSLGVRYARYPLAYEPVLGQSVDEERNDVALYWRPLYAENLEHRDVLRPEIEAEYFIDEVDLSLNWRYFDPQDGNESSDQEVWLALGGRRTTQSLQIWGDLELFTEGSQSLSGGVSFFYGDQIRTTLQLTAGRTWGEQIPGHTTFRIGGDLTEGYFTRRAPRLFPVRGFDSNVIEAPTVATATAEVYWPLANLQRGYGTLPLFLHRLRLGTFVDAGYAKPDSGGDSYLVGAGLELLTSVEVGWGGMSTFRIGVSWPLEQPDGLDQDGPVFIFQIGRPL